MNSVRSAKQTFMMQNLSIEGHKLAALCLNPQAEGNPIVLIHGINTSVRFWTTRDHLDIFLRQGPCYALSLPGHYPAALPPNFTQEMFTEDMLGHVLHAAIQQLVGDRPVTLVGHSTGGFVALYIAACMPNTVQRLITISGFAQGKWTGALGLNQCLARQGVIGQNLFKRIYAILGSSRCLFRQSSRIYAATARTFFAYRHLTALIDSSYPDFEKLKADEIIHYFRAMPDLDISYRLPDIKVPTLVMAGDRDPIVPVSQSRLIHSKLSGCKTLAIIEKAGHVPSAEKPVEYHLEMMRWLRTTR